jgi:hypothetical protein
VFRFIGRSSFPDRDVLRQPGSALASTGSRWEIPAIAGLTLTAPVEDELADGDSFEPTEGDGYTFEWEYVSNSHGYGNQALGGTVFGVAEDPHLRGVAIEVTRQSDGAVLREDNVDYPFPQWTYTAAERTEDGNANVNIAFRQYDDRGFFGPAVTISIATPGAS